MFNHETKCLTLPLFIEINVQNISLNTLVNGNI